MLSLMSLSRHVQVIFMTVVEKLCFTIVVFTVPMKSFDVFSVCSIFTLAVFVLPACCQI